MSSAIFIVATDTDAGKTWVTTQCLKHYQRQVRDVQALKPIACGLDVAPSNESAALNEDVQQLLDLQPRLKASDINYKTYIKPVAPALAARVEGSFDADALLQWIKEQQCRADITLIESVGGLMTPLLASDEDAWLVSHWLEAMDDAEILLVVPLRLGCLNQALLACTALSRLGRAPRWIILNDLEGTGSGEETRSILQPCLRAVFGFVPDVQIVLRSQCDFPFLV